MPNLEQANAKIGNNNPLNALVHVLVAKMGDVLPDAGTNPDQQAVKNEFSNAFNEVCSVDANYLLWDDIQAILQEKDPVHREILLGPVLERMVPDAEKRGTEISPESVAKLAQRFGIRVESYETVEGALIRIKEELRLSEQPLPSDATFVQQEAREDSLRRKARAQYQKELAAKGKNPTEIQAIMTNPGRRDALDDRIQDDTHRQPKDTAVATLRLVQEGSGYRFEALNRDGENPADRAIDNTAHNAKSYQIPCDYAQAAPVLRDKLNAAVTAAMAEPDFATNSAEILKNKTTTLFTEYQTEQAAKASKSGTEKGGFLGGMGDAIKTFFDTKDPFGSIKGLGGILTELFAMLFGPESGIMKLLMGFEDMNAERNKKPGDAPSKKEIEAYASDELRAAAVDFESRVKALAGNTGTQERLFEQWRTTLRNTGADSTEVWVSLIDALLRDKQANAADACLSDREDKMLKTLQALKTECEAAHQPVDGITELIARYTPAGSVGKLKTPALRDKPESIDARLNLLKTIDAKVRELSKQHSKVQELTAQKTQAERKKDALAAQQAHIVGTEPSEFTKRLQAARDAFNKLDNTDGLVQTASNDENTLLGNIATAMRTGSGTLVPFFQACVDVSNQLERAEKAREQQRIAAESIAQASQNIGRHGRK